MPEFLSAGVYIQEKKSQQQSINGVSTSTFGTVGWTQRGPENIATLVGSLPEFINIFGGFWNKSDLPLAMTGFFQNGGARAYVVRVTPTDAVAASVTTTNNEWIFTASSKGTWGNLVRVILSGNDNYYDQATATYSRFDLQVQEESDDGEDDWTTTETFEALDLTDSESANYLTTVLNDEATGSDLIIATEVSGGIPVALQSTQVTDESIGTGDGNATQTVSGSLTGPVAEYTLQIYVSGVQVAEDDGRGVIAMIDGAGYTSIDGTIDYDSGDFEILFTPAPTNGAAITANYYIAPAAAARYELTGGLDGTSVGRAQVTSPALAENGEGIYAFDEVSDMLNLGLPDFYGNQTVHSDLLAFCQEKGDRFAILDTPRGYDTAQALNYKRNTLASLSSWGAMYYPHIKVADPVIDGKVKTISPVGHIAGIYARTDNNRNVAKAPAGVEDGQINGIIGLERKLKKSDTDVLYPANVNPLVEDATRGRAVWGSRCLAITGDYTQVPHRRLYMFLAKSIYNSTQDLVFEPIGEGLFATVKFRMDGFLSVLTGFGYFISQVPSEAYRVICDDTNNTAQTIAARILIVDILVAMSSPAEFILFRVERSLTKL